jgi:hypothetical protein
LALAIAMALLVAAGVFAVMLIRTVRRGWDRLLGRPPDAKPSRFGGVGSPPERN